MSDAAVSTRHALHNSSFRLLWAGNTISVIGDQFYFVALPWLVLQLTGSGVVLGTITMTAAIPRAALMLVGGAVTDYFSPRLVMIGASLSRGVAVAAISVLIWANSLHLWQLYILSFCFGAADAFANPAAQAYIPSLVSAEELPSANSLLQLAGQLAGLAAPAPVGLFVKLFGTAWAFFLDALSFLFIVGALLRLPDPPRTSAARGPRNVLGSIMEGLHYVHRDAVLSTLVFVIAVLNFAISGPVVVGVAFIAKTRLGSATSFGLLLSSVAAGSLVGVLLAPFCKLRNRGYLFLLVSAWIGICLGAIGWINRTSLLAILLFAMSGAAAFLNIQLIAWFQNRVDREAMGRVISVLMFASIGLTPISLAVAGIAIRWSLPGMFAMGGILVILTTLFAASRRHVREID